MHGERDRARGCRWRQHIDPEPWRRVEHDLPGLPAPGRSEARDERGELRIGHCEDDEFAPLDDHWDLEHRRSRQDCVGPLSTSLRHR